MDHPANCSFDGLNVLAKQSTGTKSDSKYRSACTVPTKSILSGFPDTNAHIHKHFQHFAKMTPPTDSHFSSQTIRSFVLRQGRMSPAQRRAIETLMPLYGLPYHPERLDWDSVFARKAPRVVEIGFGMGVATAEIAQALPEKNFLGIEVHGPGVGNLCQLIEREKIPNLKVVQHDAVEVMENMIAPDSLAGIHLYFPDPWPKKKHHKRRIVQPAFIQLLATRLAPDGYLHCATDWEEYAEHMLAILRAEPLLINTSTAPEGFVPRPDYRPLTKFEQRGLRLGHGVWDLIFTKRAPGEEDKPHGI